MDATNPKPWLNKSAFQVRDVTKDNIIGTEEGDLLQSFVNEVESTQQLQGTLGASVPLSELVSIGMDAELSRNYSASQKSIGRKIITRTISFRSDFDDIDDGKRAKVNLSKEKDSPRNIKRKQTFENQLHTWIYNKLKEKKIVQSINNNRPHRGGRNMDEDELTQDVLVGYCYKFVCTYAITHYVHSLELGASHYRVMSSEEFATTFSSKTKLGVGQMADIAIGTEGYLGGRKVQSKTTMIGQISDHGGKSHSVSKGVTSKNLTVKRHTIDEAVVGVKLQPISSLVVKAVELRVALQEAVQRFIEEHQKVKCKLCSVEPALLLTCDVLYIIIIMQVQ